MPILTIKLDQWRADQLTRWARSRKMTKSAVVRELIDGIATIETGDDLIRVLQSNSGRGLELYLKDR